MKLLDIYSLLLSNWLNSGGFDQRSKLEATSINPRYNMIFTRSWVKQVYRITGVKPINVDLAFVDFIRAKMFELSPDVDVTINEVNVPVRVQVTSDKFARGMAKSSEAYQNYKDAFESQSGVAKIIGKTYRLPNGARLRLSRERLEDLQQVYESYHYLYDYVTTGGTCCITNIFIELKAVDSKELRQASDSLYGIMASLNIGLEIVKSATKAYMLEDGAASPVPMKVNKRFSPQMLMSSENSTAFSTYKSRGFVGGGKDALLFGVDLRSRLPLSFDIFRSGAAQVFMILGKTGSGKTFSAFQIAISALAIGCYVSALDLKGREWSKISFAYTPKILSFDPANPSFVNTLRLDDMNVDETTAHEYFETAIRGTVQLFMLVLNLQPGESNPVDAEMVIREAVEKMYSMRGVSPDVPNSFAITRTMKYADILPILETLATSSTYTQEQRDAVHLARSRLHAYFSESGLFAENFRNEISLGDILESKYVIYELNKNQDATITQLDVIRVFMVMFLDSKKKAMLRKRDKFIFSFYEELQRTGSMKILLEYICADVTGSRSNNAVLFLLMNSLKILQGEAAQDIRSNITSMVVGFCEDNDIKTIREDFNKPWLAHELELFAERQNIYRNCFAVEVDTGVETYQTVYKVELPSSIAKEFRTRTIKED